MTFCRDMVWGSTQIWYLQLSDKLIKDGDKFFYIIGTDSNFAPVLSQMS